MHRRRRRLAQPLLPCPCPCPCPGRHSRPVPGRSLDGSPNPSWSLLSWKCRKLAAGGPVQAKIAPIARKILSRLWQAQTSDHSACPLSIPPGQEMKRDQFDHERLDVYQRAIEFVVVADGIVENLPRGRAYLADQLHRAATSIPLNTAEGAGEFAANEKARFYRMAKRSATECAAILDVCGRLELVAPATHNEARELLLRIVSMLTKLAK